MGTMTEIGMPVGLTFAGRAYDDTALLALAAAFEVTGARRTTPFRTPPCERFRLARRPKLGNPRTRMREAHLTPNSGPL